MRLEDDVLFALARPRFTDAHRHAVAAMCRQRAVNWGLVLRLARADGVAPLVCANLRRCAPRDIGVPDAVLGGFSQALFAAVAVKARLAPLLAEALAIFEARSFEVMVVKGAAYDLCVYDSRWHTLGEDVDLAVRPRAGGADWRGLDVDLEAVNVRARAFDQCIEYDFDGHHDLTINGLLRFEFGQVWDAATPIDLDGRTVFVPSPEDMLVFACVNACRKRFFRLKSLCDVSAIVERWPALDWATVAAKARAYGCANIVLAALVVTRATMRTVLPAGALGGLAVHPLRAALIRRLAGRLVRHGTLSSLARWSGRDVLGRRLNLSLALPYATYTTEQAGRKAAEAVRAGLAAT